MSRQVCGGGGTLTLHWEIYSDLFNYTGKRGSWKKFMQLRISVVKKCLMWKLESCVWHSSFSRNWDIFEMPKKTDKLLYNLSRVIKVCVCTTILCNKEQGFSICVTLDIPLYAMLNVLYLESSGFCNLRICF